MTNKAPTSNSESKEEEADNKLIMTFPYLTPGGSLNTLHRAR